MRMNDRWLRTAAGEKDRAVGTIWIRFRAKREAFGPRPVSAWSLIWATVPSLVIVFGDGSTETHDPGGLPASLMLWIAGPALFVNIQQRVLNAGRALAAGAVVGVSVCLMLCYLLGSEDVDVDFFGIVVGMIVFDVVYWLVSRRPGRSAVSLAGSPAAGDGHGDGDGDVGGGR